MPDQKPNYPWLSRAMDSSTPLYEGKSTVRTETSEVDGEFWVYPTIRMIDGKLVELSSEDAFNYAMDKEDYIVAPDQDTADALSRDISRYIQDARGMAEGGYVNPLNMPSSAGPTDFVVGQNDAGQDIYETMTGRRYVISRDPDQRTPRRKASDFVKNAKEAIRNWWENPELPTGKQVTDVALGVAEGAYNEVDNLVHDRGTLGEALGVAPVTAVPSFMRAVKPSSKSVAEALPLETDALPEVPSKPNKQRTTNTQNPKENPLMKDSNNSVPATIDSKVIREFSMFQEYFSDPKYTDGNISSSNLEELQQQVSILLIDNYEELPSVKRLVEMEGIDGVNSVVESEVFDMQSAEKMLKDVFTGEGIILDNDISNPATGVVARFYNPAVSTLESMTWGNKGLRGETIAAYLEKRSTGVRSSLLQSISGGKPIFKPNQRYTLEEATQIINDNSFTVEAVSVPPKFQDMQRIENRKGGVDFGAEVDYGEIILRTSGQKLARWQGDHYNDASLGHTRYSVRNNENGNYLLVEELQSDLVQRGFKAPMPGSDQKIPPIASTTEFVRPLIHSLVVEAKRQGVDTIIVPDAKTILEARDGMANGLHAKEYGKAFENTYDTAVNKVLAELDRERGVDVSIASSKMYGKPTSSFDLPPIEDFGLPTIKDFDSLTRENSALTDDLNTILDEMHNFLVRAYGPTAEERLSFIEKSLEEGYFFGIDSGALDSEKVVDYLRGFLKKDQVAASPVRVINLESLEFDPDKIELRFAEGGLVPDMNDQTEMAFMQDQQPEVDPVSGNDVPPGSTPEEVRDDVPAKLSEGEFVIPADVVKFFGVKYFYDLIRKGKEGFSKEMGDLPIDTNELQYEDTQPTQ